MFPCGSIACVFSGDIKQINYKLKKMRLVARIRMFL